MELKKTIIIPLDNAVLAKELFENSIYKEELIIMVVLGDDEKIKDTVQKADKVAHIVLQGYNRKVIWIRNSEILKEEILALSAGKANILDEDLDNILAFTVSLSDTVADTIKCSDTTSMGRLDLAFIEASEV